MIDTINWSDFNYKPEVSFKLAWTTEGFLLRYVVKEDVTAAVYQGFNRPVWKDSCVEFFITVDDGDYINFEINPIGALLCFKGPNRTDRIPFPDNELSKICIYASEGSIPFTEKKLDSPWEICALIPFSLLKIRDACPGNSFNANFYKCGDELSKPHYLTWSPINTPKPDYHRPDFFGTLRLI